MLTVLDDLGLPMTRRHGPDVEEIVVDLSPVDDPASRFALAVHDREVQADRARHVAPRRTGPRAPRPPEARTRSRVELCAVRRSCSLGLPDRTSSRTRRS